MRFESSFIGRPSTIRAHTSLYRARIKPLIKDHSLREMVQIWQSEGLAPRTIQALIGLSSRYYRWRGQPDLESAALSRVIGKQIPPDPPKALTKEQAHKLIVAWEETEPDYHGFISLGVHGGLRIGEVFGLRWGDIDLLKGRIQVLHSYDGPTKSGRGRIVPMSNHLSKCFQINHSYLGSSVDQHLFKRFQVNRKLNRACERAGIPIITYHALRHTFATLALESGQSIKAVSTILGHASVKTTLDVYWNVLPETLDLEFIE
jgi:integrase